MVFWFTSVLANPLNNGLFGNRFWKPVLKTGFYAYKIQDFNISILVDELDIQRYKQSATQHSAECSAGKRPKAPCRLDFRRY